jgi:hypothetical protein
MKPEIRILGIDDSPIENKKRGEEVGCIGTIYRGGNFLDGLISFKIKKDGKDSSEKIIRNVNKTKHYEQLQYIIIDGITLAGFNVVDINRIYEETKLPVIVVIRKKPDLKKFLKALDKVNPESKEIIKKTGSVKEVKINQKNLYLQLAGISIEEAKKILLITCIHSNIPEPIRVSHLIASGIHYGESKGGA